MNYNERKVRGAHILKLPYAHVHINLLIRIIHEEIIMRTTITIDP